MYKRKKGRKFGRKRDIRRAFLRSLARSLLEHQKIFTTQARAKELRPFIEKLITRSRKDELATIRYLRKYFDEKIVWKMIKEIGPRYVNRQGGYTRVIKMPSRKGDGAKMAVIELAL